ncbi:MAG: MerR family transcriptional regulator [Candidatus Rokuibacteriota bacterium]
MRREGLLIGEVASRSGLSRKAIRLYESRGILAPASRTEGGYRVYSADVLALLKFVATARRLGFSLAEIADIVAIRRAGQMPCAHVYTHLRQKAMELEEMRKTVRIVLGSWRVRRNRTAVVCPHLEVERR